jgi:hypothetical protein
MEKWFDFHIFSMVISMGEWDFVSWVEGILVVF